MPLDPTLDELSSEQQRSMAPALPRPSFPGINPTLDKLSSEQQRSMTHEPDSPNPVRSFIDYAQQPAPPRTPMPGEERINQALTRQDPRYAPMQAPQQQNWQRWGEEALSNLPFGFLSSLRMSRMTGPKNRWGSDHNFDLISKETGVTKGELYTNYDQAKNDLQIEFLGSAGLGNKRFWGIGTHELESLGPELLREFPNINTISFTRPRHGLTLQYQVTKTPEGGLEMKRIKEYKSGNKIGISGTAFGPSQPPQSPLRPAPRATPPPQYPATAVRPDDPRSRLPPIQPMSPAEEQFWREAEERQRRDAEWNASMERLFGSLTGR